jgi:drug/metabolite transporter (DMT)-like permease
VLLLAQDSLSFPSLLFLGIGPTGWTAKCEQEALKVLSAREATLIYTMEPIFASIFAAYFLKEYWTWNTFFGAAFVILGCLLH